MKDPQSILDEFTEKITNGGDTILGFVARLGTAPEDDVGGIIRWVSDVVRRGIACDLSQETIRWLLLKARLSHNVDLSEEKTDTFFNSLYDEQKALFLRDPRLYRLRYSDMPKGD